MLLKPSGAKSIMTSLAPTKLALGLESSCDETAAAIVAEDGTVLSSLIASQIELHRPYGGVVPEAAARAHLEKMDLLVEEALAAAKVKLSDLSLIASTAGPGLIGGLLVAVTYGRMLARASGVPWYGVNHLEGHALTARLTDKVAFPYLLLLVSGGHSQLVWVEGIGRYRRLGTTLDDAAGECFDKAAKLLGLGYPGGPALEKAAIGGDAKRFALPHPMVGREGCDFSFSGLKTAVRHKVASLETVTAEDVRDLSAATQTAIAASIADRTRHALQSVGQKPSALVVAGGVAANQAIRSALRQIAEQIDIPLIAPPLALCGDNAAMIAWAGLERLVSGVGPEDEGHPRPRWPLDPTTLGSGLRSSR